MAVATAIAIAATAATAGISAYGQKQAADAAEDTAEYNAKIAENDAVRKEQENHEDVKRQRSDKRAALAQAKARLAANGAALGEGSALDVLTALDSRLETGIQDSARSAQLETRAIRHSSNLATYTAQQQSASLTTQSFGTLLGGVSNTAGQISTARYNS